MDAALIRIILTAIAENNPSAIQPGESAQVIAWMKNRVRISRPDRGGEIVHDSDMEVAARAAEQAFALFQRGEVGAANPLALEAMKVFTG